MFRYQWLKNWFEYVDLLVPVKYLFLEDRSVLDVAGSSFFVQGNNSDFQDSLASEFRNTKKKKIQNPCVAFKKANMNCKANAASRFVDTKVKIANSQVSPNRNIMPQIESINFTTSKAVSLDLSILCLFFCKLCFIKTRITSEYTTVLKMIIRNIGPRKAPKNTPMSLM